VETAPPTTQAVEQQPVALGVGQNQVEGPNVYLAFSLSVLVGAAAFALIWKMRKTFGMKE
jgi:hypothetical protein